MLYTVAKKSSFYFGGNNCQLWRMIFKRIVLDEYYLFSSDTCALEAARLLLWQQMM